MESNGYFEGEKENYWSQSSDTPVLYKREILSLRETFDDQLATICRSSAEAYRDPILLYGFTYYLEHSVSRICSTENTEYYAMLFRCIVIILRLCFIHSSFAFTLVQSILVYVNYLSITIGHPFTPV